MGDMADDAYDSAMRWEEEMWDLIMSCPETPKGEKCHWEINDDGLFECKTCGEVVDL